MVLAAGLSAEALQAVTELIGEKAIHLEPASTVLVYLIDGGALNLPLVKSAAAAKRGYKTPHWFPVVLQAGA